MSTKRAIIMAAVILVGGTSLASAANTSTNHNVYSGHQNSAAKNAEHNVYAGHKATAGVPYGYNDAPGHHALGSGPG